MKYLFIMLLVVSFLQAQERHGNHSGDPANFNMDRAPRVRAREQVDAQTNTRSYVDGISDLTTQTVTPLNVSVTTPVGQAIGSINIQKRVFTETVWEFSTNDLAPRQHIFDHDGRAVLVDGRLSCRVTHRETLSDYVLAGLSLGLTNQSIVPGVSVTVNSGFTFETLRNTFWESSQVCSVGPIPAFTSAAEIARLCAPCHREVLPTLRNDVRARMRNLVFQVNNSSVCRQDLDCAERRGSTTVMSANTVDRCVLVRDRNNSHYSECRSRSLEGRNCPGAGSSGMFEYPCDRGLQCVRVLEGSGYWNWSGRYEYSRYVCMRQRRD